MENQLILDRAAVAGTTSRIDGADRLAAAADRGGSGCSGSATWPSLQSSQASGERPRMDQSTIGSSATSLQLLSVCFLHFQFLRDFLNMYVEELINFSSEEVGGQNKKILAEQLFFSALCYHRQQ